MLNDLIALRNRLQPSSPSNSDNLIYDYKYWTELEKITKKQRETALKTVLALSDKPTTDGTVVNGSRFALDLKTSSESEKFDLEVFLEALIKKYPDIMRHDLRQLATTSVVKVAGRKTYSVRDKEDD